MGFNVFFFFFPACVCCSTAWQMLMNYKSEPKLAQR